VLLDPALPPERIAALIRFFDPAIVLTQLRCPAAADQGTLVLRCTDDYAELPYAWPDEHPVQARTTACAVPYQQAPRSFGIAMLTHEDLHALCDTPAVPPGSQAMAGLWGPLTHGAPITLPP